MDSERKKVLIRKTVTKGVTEAEFAELQTCVTQEEVKKEFTMLEFLQRLQDLESPD